MSRPTNHAAHLTAAVNELLKSVTALVTTVGNAVAKSAEVKAAAKGVGHAGKEAGKAASAKSAKLRRSLKAYWSKMKGKAREERIAKMLRGRGLEPKKK
jgi:hypothetical protein